MLLILSFVACGPGYLTPDEVREHLDNPTGSVDASTLGNVADDYFDAQKGMNAQDLAFFVKSDQGGGRRGNAQRLSGLMQSGPLGALAQSPVAKGTAGDIFCATTIVAQVATFDSCEQGGDCEADLSIDACVLRLGEDGDENAKGKLHFYFSEQSSPEVDSGELQIEFDKWQYTVQAPAVVDFTDGILAFEYSDFKQEPRRSEMILSIDLLNKQIDQDANGLFSNGVLSEHRSTAALRTVFEETATGETASLEILAFTDEDLSESLNLRFDYEATWISDTRSTFEAAMTVVGSNGSFQCIWSSDVVETEALSSYTSAGVCTDENGESFDWSGDLVVEG